MEDKRNSKWYITLLNKLSTKGDNYEKNKLNDIINNTRALECSMGLDTTCYKPKLSHNPKPINNDAWCKSFIKVSNLVTNCQSNRIHQNPKLSKNENVIKRSQTMNITSNTTYMQSIRKLRNNPRRPLLQVVLIQHMVHKIRDDDSVNLDREMGINRFSSEIPCHLTGVKNRKIKSYPTLVQIFSNEKELQMNLLNVYTEDDDIPIALLNKRK
ncbi:hypothetical protein K502DRAFT_329297 [Neoconidiobolus thromboides FSU 785]|nr:hypothetical protein K502DRAFT_329297 [Neoconidiobolus thromboides FSU 785]